MLSGLLTDSGPVFSSWLLELQQISPKPAKASLQHPQILNCTPYSSWEAHCSWLLLCFPSHSHFCLDGETGQIVTAFIIISTVDDLTWAFSPLIAASKLTRIWGVCPFGKPGWAWPANPEVVWGIGLQISFLQETILYLKFCFIGTESFPFLWLLLAFKRSFGL